MILLKKLLRSELSSLSSPEFAAAVEGVVATILAVRQRRPAPAAAAAREGDETPIAERGTRAAVCDAPGRAAASSSPSIASRSPSPRRCAALGYAKTKSCH